MRSSPTRSSVGDGFGGQVDFRHMCVARHREALKSCCWQDSARGWRFVDARYVFRNTSGAVRFMADGRLGTPTTRCPSTPHTGAAKSKET